MPQFSVIICTYQRYDLLPQAVESVREQKDVPGGFDIWVMDNSPASAEREAAAARYAGIDGLHYVLLDRAGLSNARNEGIERSRGEILVFLDDDAEAAPGWLSHLSEAFAKTGEKTGVVGGKVSPRYDGEKPSWLSEDLSAPFSLLDCASDLCEFPKQFWPFGANMAIRRQVFAEAGTFPTNLGRQGAESVSLLSGEETALFEKSREIGWRFFYSPFAEVAHHVSVTRMTQAWLRRRMAWQAVTAQMMGNLDREFALALFAGVLQFSAEAPPEHGPLMGLFWDTPDPEAFKRQLCAVTNFVRLMLATGSYPEGVKL